MEVFDKTFWQDNEGTQFCPFANADTVHLLAYAIIMLNTDLHRANLDTKGKRTKKMTKEEFISNLRGIDDGKNVDRKYLAAIYDSILLEPIIMNINPTSSLRSTEAKASVDDPGLASEASQFVADFHRGVRDAEDLMRSLAPFNHLFQLTGIDTNISLDLVSFMFEAVDVHFLKVAKELLDTLNKEVGVTFAALDIINYCICSSIFLGLNKEKLEFGKVLLRFKRSFSPESGESDILSSVNIGHIRRHAKSLTNDNYTEKWFEELLGTNADNALDHIAMIQSIINSVKENVQTLGSAHATKAAVSKIEKRARVLEENTFFVREGDLIKTNRSGGKRLYRFFLFSDTLMYAHQNFFGEYTVHTKLSLLSLQVTDEDNDETKSTYSFKINHPDKSFVVSADSPFSKYMWVKDIQQTVSACRAKVRMQSEKAVDSIIDRIEHQLEEQHLEVRKRSIAFTDRVQSVRYLAMHFDQNALASATSSMRMEPVGSYDRDESDLPPILESSTESIGTVQDTDYEVGV